MSLLILLNPPPAPGDNSPVRPTVDEVAALLRERTYMSGGGSAGTFNTSTRPTADQVEELIDMALADVASRVGNTISDKYAGEARRLAALQTASLVEASYFPAQLDTDRSAHRQYQAMFLGGIERLVELVNQPTAVRLA